MVDGTFSLELIHLANGSVVPISSSPWTSARNSYRAGRDLVLHSKGIRACRSGDASSHGSMSPWTIRNTCLAWGRFRAASSPCPAPVTWIWCRRSWRSRGIPADASHNGRLTWEGIDWGPDEEQIAVDTRVMTTAARGGHLRRRFRSRLWNTSATSIKLAHALAKVPANVLSGSMLHGLTQVLLPPLAILSRLLRLAC
jgi:hypothetical protein